MARTLEEGSAEKCRGHDSAHEIGTFSARKHNLPPESFFYNCRMLFRKTVLKSLAATLLLCAFCASQSAAEEEKSLWQRFIDWFKPAPTLEGEGPLYDELKELDDKIDRIEGRYSRERRPGNKSRLKKEMEDLKKKREKLVEKILEEEKAKKNQPAVAAPASSSAKQVPASSATTPASSATVADTSKPAIKTTATVCTPDTVFVRDTVIVHDTLYVIVAGKPGENATPAQTNAQPADSAAAPQADQTSK